MAELTSISKTESAVTGQAIKEAKKLKDVLREMFAGRDTFFVDAVIRLAHTLMIAEAEAEKDFIVSKFAKKTLSKLPRRTIKTLRA
jgi:hypothetical protein